jgi:hypothetical protein
MAVFLSLWNVRPMRGQPHPCTWQCIVMKDEYSWHSRGRRSGESGCRKPKTGSIANILFWVGVKHLQHASEAPRSRDLSRRNRVRLNKIQTLKR